MHPIEHNFESSFASMILETEYLNFANINEYNRCAYSISE